MKEWKKRFGVEEGEELVCTHSCALVSGIMLHGRLYISTKAVGFRSNILGVKTKRHFPLSEISSVTPTYVAGCIPNAFLITHGDVTEEFTTLPDRDHTLLHLFRCWKLSSPAAYAKYIVDMKVQAENKEPAPGNAAGKEGEAGEGARRLLKVVGETSVVEDENVVVDDDGQVVEKGSVGKVGEKEEVLVGVHPATNPTTKPLEKISCTSRIRATPEESYRLLFHNDAFLKAIWEKQGFKDINLSPWKDSTRKFSYLKPVGGKFGSVKCMSTETIKVEDPEVGFEIEGITKTPDVPSGKSFQTRSMSVFSHDGKGGTKMVSSFQVEWSGSSLLKGMINGQAESGQKAWSKLVASEMREYVRNHPDDFHFGGKVVEGEEQEDDDNDEGEGSGEGATSTHVATLNAFATATHEWIQEDAVRGLLAIALALSLSLHFWNYLLSFYARS